MIGKPLKDTCKGCGKIKTLSSKTKKLCQTCINDDKRQKKREKKEFVKQTKRISITSLVKKLDRVFSVYIRLRYANRSGEVTCFTCDKKMHWRSSQCGHFMSRRYMSTRFHEQNCMVQCYGCNIMMSGNQFIYGLKLDEMFGDGKAQEMLALSRQQNKFIVAELEDLIKEYESKVDSLRRKLNIWD